MEKPDCKETRHESVNCINWFGMSPLEDFCEGESERFGSVKEISWSDEPVAWEDTSCVV